MQSQQKQLSPFQQRAKLHSTNPLERVIGDIKRRTEVVGIFPKDPSLACPGPFSWGRGPCSEMILETIAPMSEDPLVSLPALAS